MLTRLNEALNEGLRSAQVRDGLTKVGAGATPMTSQEFAASIAAEAGKRRHIVKLASITPEQRYRAGGGAARPAG